jgi:hypothetical protein
MWWVLFWLQTWHCLTPFHPPNNLLVNVDNLILCKKVWHGLLMRINWTSSSALLSFAKEYLTNIATTSKVMWNSCTNYLSKWPKGGRPQKLITYFQSLTIANTCNHLEWWDLKKWKHLKKVQMKWVKKSKEWMGCIGTKCIPIPPTIHKDEKTFVVETYGTQAFIAFGHLRMR